MFRRFVKVMYKFWNHGGFVFLKNRSFTRKISTSLLHLNNKERSVRIGCASGFWGDTSTAGKKSICGHMKFFVFHETETKKKQLKV